MSPRPTFRSREVRVKPPPPDGKADKFAACVFVSGATSGISVAFIRSPCIWVRPITCKFSLFSFSLIKKVRQRQRWRAFQVRAELEVGPGRPICPRPERVGGVKSSAAGFAFSMETQPESGGDERSLERSRSWSRSSQFPTNTRRERPARTSVRLWLTLEMFTNSQLQGVDPPKHLSAFL